MGDKTLLLQEEARIKEKASKKDEMTAMRTLLHDYFLDGDRELVDNDSLFLFRLIG